MADEKEDEILLTVEIDEGAVEKRLIELRKASIQLRAEKEALKKANKDGTLSADDYAKSLTKTQIALNATTKEIVANERTLANNTKQQQAATGSITQMRAQVSLLYADWANLSKEERKNAEVGGVLQKQLKDLNDELKAEESAVGDNRRSVGGYAEAIEQAIAGNSNWTGQIRGTIASLSEAKDNMKSYIDGLKGTTSGMNGAQKASVGLGLGLKAIGIGLLITAITALIGFLSKMDAGMDKIEQVTAAVSAGFEAFIQTIAPIGELIVNTFEHPIDSIVAFGNALLHPIDTFLKLKAGAEDMADSVAVNVGKAARAAVEYTKVMQDQEDAQDGLISKQAEVNQLVSIALIAAKDRSKSEKERIALLDKAGKAEADLSKKVVAIKQAELNALIKFQKSKTDLQDADRKQLQETTAALTDAQTANLETEQKIQNRRSALIEQEVAARKAAADKAKEIAKKAADEQVAAAERELIVAKQNGEDTLKIEETIIRRRLLAESVGLAKSSQQRLLLTAKANADILKLNADHTAELIARDSEVTQNRIGAQLALTQKGSEAELALQKKALEDKLLLDKSEAVATIKNKTQQTAKLRLLDAQFNATNEQLTDAFAKGEIERATELNRLRLQTEIDLGAQTFAAQQANQQKQIELEEKHALDLLKLEEDTAKERNQLDEKLSSDLLVRRNAIQAKRLAAEKQLAQEAIAREKADAVAIAEARLAGLAEGSKAELDARKKLLKAQFDAELANAKLTAAEVAKVKAQYQAADAKLTKDYNKQLAEDIINTVSLAKDTLSTAFEAQTTQLLASLDKQQAAALTSAGANADLRARIEEQYQKKRAKIEKEAAEKRRKIASIENLIATAQATTAALALFAKNPILGAITEALILVKAVKNQQLIDSQAFAEGGAWFANDGRGAYVRGPGSGKSDSINARISNGESILTARATDMFYNELSAMNVAGGGRAFPGAGDEPVPQVTAFAFGGVSQGNGNAELAAQIVQAMRGANFAVAVTDIHKVEDDLIYAKASGDS